MKSKYKRIARSAKISNDVIIIIVGVLIVGITIIFALL